MSNVPELLGARVHLAEALGRLDDALEELDRAAAHFNAVRKRARVAQLTALVLLEGIDGGTDHDETRN